jgi:hypothetical protein
MHYLDNNLIKSIPDYLNYDSDLNLRFSTLNKKLKKFSGYPWLIIVLVITTLILTILVILLIVGVIGGNKQVTNQYTTTPSIDTSTFVKTDKSFQDINGQLAVNRLISGDKNVLIGGNAGINQNSANIGNIFIGDSSGYSDTTGQGNTFMGSFSGFFNTTGSNNTFLGNTSGQNFNPTSSGNIAIGSGAGPSSETINNSLWISTINTVSDASGSYYILAYDPSQGRVIPLATGSKVAYLPTQF